MTRLRSESGDIFDIPKEQYEEESKAYRAAVDEGDESTMLYYEEGDTGWELVDD